LIALAIVVIAAAGFASLRSALTPKPPAVPTSVDPRQVSAKPVDYYFITPSMGWASLITAGPSSEAGQFRVFRTTEGAQHWQQQLVLEGQGNPGFGSGSYAPISVQMFGKTGFMTIGGPVAHLYRTLDGGAHWDSVGLPDSPRIDSVALSDPSYGWLLALPVSPRTGALILYLTSNGGDSWQRLADPPVDAAGLGFRQPTEAWLGAYGPGPPHVYTSSNAGQSWLRHDLPAPAGGSWTPDPFFPGPTTRIQLLPKAGAIAHVEVIKCASAGSATCPSATAEAFLFTSRDGGITWKQIPSPPGRVTFQDSTHWWATSINALFKSADAGHSWKQVATISPDRQFSVPGILDSTHA